MKKLLSTSKTQLGILITIVFLTAFINTPSIKIIELFIASITSAVLFDFLFLKIRKVPFFFPSAAVVSGVIIALLIDPDLPLYIPIVTAAFAMFSKNFVKVGRHIFNPAAFGLLIVSLLFNYAVSWWGVSFQQFSNTFYFIILLSPAIVSLYRMKRFRITGSFLIAYAVVNFILNTKYMILNTFFDPTVIFFSTVMLPEPMTSPNNHIRQILFGTTVAILSLLISTKLSTFNLQLLTNIDPFILALLFSNLLFFRYR